MHFITSIELNLSIYFADYCILLQLFSIYSKNYAFYCLIFDRFEFKIKFNVRVFLKSQL